MAKPSSGTNSILTSFSTDDRLRWFADAEEVALTTKEILHEVHGTVTHVYFPHDGLISLQVVQPNGWPVESGFVASEGATGSIYSPNQRVSFTRAKVICGGRALRLPLAQFERAMDQSADFRNLISENNFLLTARAQQIAACNLLHQLEPRLCRWLLQVFENSKHSSVEITQADLSQMLGVHRARLNEALKALEHIGSISQAHRGELTIIDPNLIADRVCDCYRRMQIPKRTRRMLLREH